MAASSNVLPYLCKVNDIKDVHSRYEISSLAREYFCKHSNINEILDIYLESIGKDRVTKTKFMDPIIRVVISMRKNAAVYPFHLFEFNSVYHECQGRMLVTYPNIATEEDLNDVNHYFSENGIKQCSVALNLDNMLRTYELEYLEAKVQKGAKEHCRYLPNSTYYALRKYYEEKDLVQNFYFDDITVEAMHEITNFGTLVQNTLIENNLADTFYDKVATKMLQTMKDEREIYLAQEDLQVYPKYNLITNNLTPEQENIVTESHLAFYACTNASILIRFYKSHFPVNEELGIFERRKQRKVQFYFKYLQQANKKLPPFHNLHWTLPESTIVRTECHSSESSKQQQSGPRNNIWLKKNTAERNDCAIDPAVVVPQTNKRKTLAYYLFYGPPPPEMSDLVKILLKQKHIVSAMKQELLLCPDYAVDLFLKQKSLIYINYIISHLKEKDEEFLGLLFKCPHDVKLQIAEQLKFFNIYETS